jgi:4,5:9,10-diseco-3-hydroxy-5,9,17-trioxoandrosta-1(10),2-diene-4-oate hydrolase
MSKDSMSESKFVEGKLADGASWRIHYTVQGSGPALILLHGAGPGATGLGNFNRNATVLARHFTTYVIDFPGWGQSSKNLNAFGAPSPFVNCARALKAFMDAVGIQKTHLVGNSLGGAAAYYLALDNPERVDRIVTMGPGGAYLEGVPPSEGVIQLLTYYMGDGPSREKVAAFLNNLVYDTSVITPDVIDSRYQASLDPETIANPPVRMPAGPPPKQAYLSEDPRLKTLPHRCLLIWGQQDKVNVPEGVKAFSVVPDQDVILFDNTGHWAQWEQADKFNELVLWFLQRA